MELVCGLRVKTGKKQHQRRLSLKNVPGLRYAQVLSQSQRPNKKHQKNTQCFFKAFSNGAI